MFDTAPTPDQIANILTGIYGGHSRGYGLAKAVCVGQKAETLILPYNPEFASSNPPAKIVKDMFETGLLSQGTVTGVYLDERKNVRFLDVPCEPSRKFDIALDDYLFHDNFLKIRASVIDTKALRERWLADNPVHEIAALEELAVIKDYTLPGNERFGICPLSRVFKIVADFGPLTQAAALEPGAAEAFAETAKSNKKNLKVVLEAARLDEKIGPELVRQTVLKHTSFKL